MTDPARFDPVTSAHAVERCGISIAFRESFPEKAYKRARDRAASSLQKSGLKQSLNQGTSFNIDLTSGKLTQGKGSFGVPIVFVSSDQTAQLVLTPNSISWQTTKYIRWAPFIGSFESAISTLIDEYVENLPFMFVSVDYWDRFIWSGDWSNINVFSLLRKDYGLISKQVQDFRREWHSHTGWFSHEGHYRRLTNVNIDVATAISLSGELRPSVGIYTSLRDEVGADGYPEVNVDDLDRRFIFERIENLHLASKLSLSHVISPEMAQRINLNLRSQT